jgi:uncharacterized protein
MSKGCIVVLGATQKEDRYAYLAMKRLQENGYRAIPVNPAFAEVLGERCYSSIRDVTEPIDTVTMYVGAARSTPLIEEIIAAKPRRIIFNPGAENRELAQAAGEAGIEVVEGCTLVMLSARTF